MTELTTLAKSALDLVKQELENIADINDIAELSKQQRRILKAACNNALDKLIGLEQQKLTMATDQDQKQEIIDEYYPSKEQLKQILALL
jgi:hypothetical protein